MPRLTTKSRRRHHAVVLDTLEPRQFLTATPADPIDLALDHVVVMSPTDVEPGYRPMFGAQATVPSSLPANVTFKLYFSTDTTLSPDDVSVFSSDVDPYDKYPVPYMAPFQVPADIAPGQYHVIGMIDADNAVAESDETNNIFLAGSVVTVHAPADASSYIPQVNSAIGPASDRSISPGSRVYPYATLGNFDDYYHIPVSFYISPDGVAGNADDIFLAAGTATRDTYSLATNTGLAYVSTTLPADLPAGTYHLVAVAAGVSYVVPSTFTVTANNTNIALTSATLPASTTANPGSSLYFDLNFSINSPAPTTYNGFFQVTYVLSTDDVLGNADDVLLTGYGRTYHDHFAGAPDPASNYQFVFPQTDFSQPDSITLPSDLAPGTYHLFAIADPNNVTAESNESDNTLQLPDITVTAPDTVSPTTLIMLATDSGQTAAPVTRVARSTRASLTLQSPGKSAGTYVVRLYLSDDPKLSRNDTLFSKQSVTTTRRPGKRSTLSLSYTLPPKTKLGTHFLIAVADAVTPQRSSASRAPVSTTATTTHFNTTTQIDVINPKKAKKDAHQALLS